MILTRCASCSQQFQVKDELAGKTGRCPKCGKALQVPARAPAPEDVTLPGPSPASRADTLLPGTDGDKTANAYDFLVPPQAEGEIGRLGSYRVLQVLGSGGMGVVFLAEDPHLRRRVALKAMKPALAASDSSHARFLREARATAALKHDHIITIYQVGEDRGVPFLAMEFLEGESLDERLKREGRLPVAEALRIGREVAEGLAAAHEAGLMHRDIKPGNLWLEGKRRRVKVLDFGLARAVGDDTQLTQSGAIVGTPAYMAPEQARGEAVDARCDLFSLGAVLYRMLTGTMPFKGQDTLSLLMSLATDTPPAVRSLNPEVPAAVSDLVMRLLEKTPQGRPASAAAVAELLAAQERELSPGAQSPTSTAPRSALAVQGPRRNRRRLVIATAAGLLALLGVGLGAPHFLRTGEQPVRQTSPPATTAAVEPPGGVAAAPFDELRRADIPAYELAQAGDGNPKQAPAELVAVLGRSRLMHWNEVDGVAFHPDGRFLASAGRDRKVRVWDVDTGEQVRALQADQWLHGVAYSPDGRLLAACGRSGALCIWDAESGQKKRDLSGVHERRVRTVAFHPNGKWLASAGEDLVVRMWDVDTGEALFKLTGHTGEISAFAFRPDGKRLATASMDRTIKVWDAEKKGEPLATLDNGNYCVGIAYSPDGKYLASTSKGFIQVWEADTGQKVRRIPGDLGTGVAFSPDGALLAVGGGRGAVQLFNPKSGQAAGSLPDSAESGRVAFSREGKRLAAATNLGHVRVWDMSTREPLWKPDSHAGPITQLALSPDQRGLASASLDRTIRLWDTSTGRETRVLKGSHGGITGIAWAPNGESLFSCADEDGVCRWNPQTGEMIGTIANVNAKGVALRPGGQQLVVGDMAAKIKVLSTSNGREIHSWPLAGTLPWAFAYSPDGKRLAVTATQKLQMWDADTGKALGPGSGLLELRYSIAFTPDGARLLVPDRNRLLTFDAATGKQAAATDLKLGALKTLACHPNGRLLALGTEQGELLLYDLTGNKVQQRWQLPGVPWSVIFTADGRHLLTGNRNGTIYVFRLAPPPG